MQIFYIPEVEENVITLNEEESKHSIRVLRMALGDVLQVVDGKGNLYTCEITDPHPKRCQVKIVDTKREFGKRSFHLHIAIAPTKNIDRFEWFLEKATEIGVDEITPIVCEHSERKTINNERLERVIVSAMKQSIKAFKPTLNPLTPINQIIKSSNESTKLIAYCGEFDEPHAMNLIERGNSVIILIGPEGDFSREEIKLAMTNGFKTVGLGPSRLRTETAGIVACTMANLINDNKK